MDNDVFSEDEVIKLSEDGIYKSLQEVFKSISGDNNYLKSNISRKTKLDR